MLKHEMSSLPKSLKEALAVGHRLYFTGKPCKHGHVTYRYVSGRICSDCAKAKVKLASGVGGGNARRWAAKTLAQIQAIYEKRKHYYKKTAETRRAERKRSYHKNKNIPGWIEQRREKAAALRAIKGRKPEKSNPSVKRRYKQSTKGRANTRANEVKRRIAKMNRTPAWLTTEDLWLIEQAYELAAVRTKLFGFAWHVDHTIPLQGKNVSGLHVPENLQVIPGVDNLRKANKYGL